MKQDIQIGIKPVNVDLDQMQAFIIMSNVEIKIK